MHLGVIDAVRERRCTLLHGDHVNICREHVRWNLDHGKARNLANRAGRQLLACQIVQALPLVGQDDLGIVLCADEQHAAVLRHELLIHVGSRIVCHGNDGVLCRLCGHAGNVAVLGKLGETVLVTGRYAALCDLLTQPLAALVADGLLGGIALVHNAVEALVLRHGVLNNGVLYVLRLAVTAGAAAGVVHNRNGIEHVNAAGLCADHLHVCLAMAFQVAVMGVCLLDLRGIFGSKIDCH